MKARHWIGILVSAVCLWWALRGTDWGQVGRTLVRADPWLLLAGWIHYLAFDLLVGAWEARDARERGIPHLFVVPSLILTFLFGPAGWLLYLGIRSRARSSRDMQNGNRHTGIELTAGTAGAR